jgi:bifunctional N-acetylglucosamine-1-phosphate-uridyltransferase/glucosamine-1-phosphate-acetyltransferase GlmU-like protein
MHSIALSIAALIFAFVTTAWAQAPYGDESKPEGWAWARIRNDEIADFNKRCRELDPHDKTGWDDPCRRIPPQFILDVLTVPKWRDQVVRHRVRLVGALIDSTIDLSDAEITAEVWINASRIEGSLLLADSRWDRALSLQGTTLTGTFSADRMRSASTILLRNHAAIKGDVRLLGATVGSNLEMETSAFAGAVNAGSLTVKGSLFMRDHARFGGEVNLVGTKVGSNLEMETSSFAGAVNANSLSVEGSLLMGDGATFDGDLVLRDAKIGKNLEMETSSFTKNVNLNRLSVAGSLLMRDHARFGEEVNLGSAKIGSNLEMETSSFTKNVNLNRLSVAGSLHMRDHARFGGEVNLVDAKVGSNLEMETSSFAGAVNANSLSVEGGLLMSDQAAFTGQVDLGRAKIGRNLEMETSSFTKNVNLNRLSVAGNLLMRDHAAFGGDVNLRGAKVDTNLEMDTSSFAGAVMADPVQVDGNLFMRNGATFKGPVSLIGAKIGGNLQLWGSAAWRVDLSGADARELMLVGLGWWCAGGKAPASVAAAASKNGDKPAPVHWRLSDPAWHEARCDASDPATLPALLLRNTHVDAFQDSADAWPPAMDLEGFHYDRLGGVGGTGRDDMRRRSSDEWTDWLARDPTFSTQPYTELSSVLAAAGHRDTADAVQLAGRERERHEACANWSRPGTCAWLTFLSYVAGYGIGLYTFFVLLWVLGLTVLGADVLWYSPNARRHRYPWRLGASLHRLLPVIELSKEFTDFFDNPPPKPGGQPNLSRFQLAYFAGHAIAGWVLGFFLLAAMGGITQKG